MEQLPHFLKPDCLLQKKLTFEENDYYSLSFFFVEGFLLNEKELNLNNQFLLLAVADGMGGHAKGEEASKIALNTITKTVIPQLNDNIPYTDLLDQGIKNANQAILDYTVEHPETKGMGTTSVCAVVKDNEVHLVNLGDSRAYVVSNDEIRRVTKDHSLVQQLVDQGTITEEETRTHPQKNVISKAIGINADIESDTMRLKLAPDEYLLLCCD